MPCFLASVASSGCRWEDPWVPWQQANCHGHVPIYSSLPLQSFLLFAFIQGLLGVGSVLHNKTIGGNCGTPRPKETRVEKPVKYKGCNMTAHRCQGGSEHLNQALLFSCSVISDSFQPHGLQHSRLPALHYLLEFVQTHVH